MTEDEDGIEPTEALPPVPEEDSGAIASTAPTDPPGRSRRLAVVGAVVVGLLVIGVLIAVAGDDDGSDVEADAGTSTTSTTEVDEVTTVLETTTTVGAAEATTPVTEPRPDRRCVEAGGGLPEPSLAGWESRWQTEPAPNDPVTMRICIDDATPAVGQTVSVTLVADDPDAVIVDQECGWFFSWEDGPGNLCRDFVVPATATVPTPPEQPGHVETTETHVYGTPGSSTVDVAVTSAEYHGYREPYSSHAEASIPVVVHG